MDRIGQYRWVSRNGEVEVVDTKGFHQQGFRQYVVIIGGTTEGVFYAQKEALAYARAFAE